MKILGLPLWGVICILLWVLLAIPQIWFWCFERPKHRRPRRTSTYLVPTQDGWRVALTHVPPETHVPGTAPVICIPGLLCNSAIFDLSEDRSLAQSLADRGLDVWLLDPRGAGHSDHAGQMSVTKPGLKLKWDYGLEEYALQDTQAAIKAVRQMTGAPFVALVGHSLGGLIAYLAASRRSDIASIVGYATPFDFSGHKKSLGFVYYHLLKIVQHIPFHLPLRVLSILFAPYFYRWIPAGLTMKTSQVDGPARRQLMLESMVDVAPKIWKEFGYAITHPHENSDRLMQAFGNTRDEQIIDLQVPILTLSGGYDRLAPDASTRAIMHHLVHSQSEKHISFAQFGHVDIVMGDHAAETVHPVIAEFLARHPRTRPLDTTERLAIKCDELLTSGESFSAITRLPR